MNIDQERQKWDRYYASLPSMDQDENILRFREEFAGIVVELLPEGGRILEAGCGAGGQSLLLAKNALYDVALLDFSSEAIKRARALFDKEGIPAQFILGDAFQPGQPEFDLVFNAGVLEHYSFDQQVSLLRGMSSRSRKYVLVLVPNIQNYWYWLWRIQKTSQGLWPFGKEIPSMNLAAAFEAAGLHYLGSAYSGSAWTEDFITGLEGLASDLSALILDIHRSGLLPEAHTSYLVAALGSVEQSPAPKGWQEVVPAQGQSPAADIETISAALADALALQVNAEREIDVLRREYLSRIETLKIQIQRLEQTNTIDLIRKVEEIEHQSAAALEERIQAVEDRHEARLTESLQKIERQRAEELAEKIRTLEQKNAAAIQEKLRQIEQENVTDLVSKMQAYERQHAIDQSGVVRQIEHDHTGVLIGKIREIENLRAQIEALRPPPTPNFSQRAKSFLIRVFTKLGLISYAIKLKSILKSIRHRFRKHIPSEVSYQSPIALGHPVIPPENRVVILTYTFFNFNGNTMYYGGAERYVLELARLIRAQGYYPEVVQCGNGYWVRYYRDLRVTGIDVGGDAERLGAEFQKLNHSQALVIFSPFSLAIAPPDSASVGISHGVFWDYAGIQADQAAMQTVINACQHLDTIISVDTNTINWMRASAAQVADKFLYIPNFVDIEAFNANSDLPEQKIIILYPRRLYRPRGYWLVAEVLPGILDRYPQVAFHFVGRADKKEAEHINALISRYPERILWYALPPEEMPQAYQQAHITIVPTVHSEGTSLSCLEALASGNAVIATNVGGLPNLILPYHNGLLIDVSAEALREALVELIENPALRVRLGERGREVALSFSSDRWQSQWQDILSRHLASDDKAEFQFPRVAFFPTAPGIPWEGIKQRPHHIAMQLAEAGIETFWRNSTRRLPSPNPLLHILGPKDETNFRRPVVIVYYPFSYTTLDQYDDPFVVYDVLDDISIHEASDETLPQGARAIDYHQRLLEAANLVITSSKVLYQRLKPQRPDILLIPNGVDLAHFRREVLPLREDSFSPARQPRIGFHGAIAGWFDDELLYEVARLRPEYQFVLLGPATIDIQHLTRLPNITHLRAVDYAEIPRHIARFDVGILPFRVNSLTNAVRPLKVLEYLAMGIPVVAVPLDEINGWPGVLPASTPQVFAEALDEALAAKNAISADKQIQEFVASTTWQKATQPLVDLLSGGSK